MCSPLKPEKMEGGEGNRERATGARSPGFACAGRVIPLRVPSPHCRGRADDGWPAQPASPEEMRVDAIRIVEALLFSSRTPLRVEEMARVSEVLDEDTVQASIEALQRHYQEQEHAFDIVALSGGYQVLTRPELASYLERTETVPRNSRLSSAALESLAVIVYRQPVSRFEVEGIRGVDCSGVIRTLVDRGLIEPVGRAEGLGRPILYATTHEFLSHFGFTGLEDLPELGDLAVTLRAEEASGEGDGEASGGTKGEDAPEPAAENEKDEGDEASGRARDA